MRKKTKLTKAQKQAQLGGIAVKEQYGSAHFSKLARDRWTAIRAAKKSV